jgi:hypothetical protein
LQALKEGLNMKLATNITLTIALLCAGPLACGDSGESPVEGDGDQSAQSCVDELESLDLAPAAPPMYTCNEQPSSSYPDSPNACRNTGDCALIETQKVRRLAKECALSCRGTSDCAEAELCNQNCLKSGTMQQLGSMLTDACSSCYAQAALCGLENCYAECADDADSLDCVECSFKKGCRLPFERCSGLDRQE